MQVAWCARLVILSDRVTTTFLGPEPWAPKPLWDPDSDFGLGLSGSVHIWVLADVST